MGISSPFGNNCSQHQRKRKILQNMLKEVISLAAFAIATQVLAKSHLTPLEIDNAPCKAENIQNQVRYTCSNKGVVQCQNGWTSVNDTDPLFPCATPICSQGCVHGLCEGPDICACDIGWEGIDCNTCIDLPGCAHGSCNGNGLACECVDGWSGGLCDIPVCENCVNGKCVAPGVCKCHPGWTGPDCDQCVPLAGCNVPVGGNCVDSQDNHIPNSCICNEDYTGHLCNEPLCDPACIEGHGQCVFSVDNTTAPICKCNVGWEGDDCGNCSVYPGCPITSSQGGCNLPYECNCTPQTESDPLCGIQYTGW